jgi:hypothetical protein
MKPVSAMPHKIKLLLLTLMMFLSTAFAMSPQDLGAKVKASMQQTFDTDEHLRKFEMTVESVRVVGGKDHRFQGIAAIHSKRTVHSVEVNITVEGEKVSWSVESEAFLFAAPEDLDTFLKKP